MKRVSLLAAVVLAALSAGAAFGADRPPNVVLILSDDHAWNDYSFMGHPQIHTPNIDRLAAEGMTFRRGYVPSSLCSPSLASIITGMYAHQHHVTGNDPPGTAGRYAQLKSEPALLEGRKRLVSFFEASPTIPRLLAGQDYATFQAGKWWGGNFSEGGFAEGMTHGDLAKGGRHGDVGLEIGRKSMAPVFDFIDREVAASKPFFVWYAPMMPHQPHTPPDRLLNKYRDKTPSLHVAKYWAMVEWFDETCGALLKHLDEKGVAENTLVVYLADNGWIQNPDAAKYDVRSKQSPYDGGLRTPIIVRHLGKIKPAVSDKPVSSIDVAPTILAAAGIEKPVKMQGVNLLDAEAVAKRPAVFGEIFTHDVADLDDPGASLRDRWVVSGDWKLILPEVRNSPGAVVELFNIVADPHESNNLAGGEPARVDELRKLIDAWWRPES